MSSGPIAPGGQSRGVEFNPKPLSAEELEQVQRLFSDPFAFPAEFLTWIRASLERDPPLFFPVQAEEEPATMMARSVGGAALKLPLDGQTYDVQVGPPGSGPGGEGRALWIA